MTLTISFDEDDQFFSTDVVIENLSGNTIEDVRFVRSFDPDQDSDLNGKPATYNKIISNPCSSVPYTDDQCALVVAKGQATGAGFFFTAFDERARAGIGTGLSTASAFSDFVWKDDPTIPQVPSDSMINTSAGYTLADVAVMMSFRCGDLAPGASTTNLRFKSSLAPDAASAFDDMRSQPVIAVNKTFVYNGESQTFNPDTDLQITDNGHPLIRGTDYNILPSSVLTGVDAGAYPFTIQFLGAYASHAPVDKTWRISPKPLTADMLTLTPGSQDYHAGTVVTQTLAVVDGGTPLVETTDYEEEAGNTWSAEA